MEAMFGMTLRRAVSFVSVHIVHCVRHGGACAPGVAILRLALLLRFAGSFASTRDAQAHFPSKAINPAPKHINPNAESSIPTFAFRIAVLNMNSWAINSTKPV